MRLKRGIVGRRPERLGRLVCACAVVVVAAGSLCCGRSDVAPSDNVNVVNGADAPIDVTPPVVVGSTEDISISDGAYPRVMLSMERSGRARLQSSLDGIDRIECSTVGDPLCEGGVASSVGRVLTKAISLRGSEARDANGVARVEFLIRADEKISWSSILSVLRVCFAPEFRVGNVLIACTDSDLKAKGPRVLKVPLPLARVVHGLEERPERREFSIAEVEAWIVKLGTEERVRIQVWGGGPQDFGGLGSRDPHWGQISTETLNAITSREAVVGRKEPVEIELSLRGEEWRLGHALALFSHLAHGKRRVFFEGLSPWPPQSLMVDLLPSHEEDYAGR